MFNLFTKFQGARCVSQISSTTTISSFLLNQYIILPVHTTVAIGIPSSVLHALLLRFGTPHEDTVDAIR